MKALFTGLLLSLSLSVFSADKNIACLDHKGNEVENSIEAVKKTMTTNKGGKIQVYVTGTISRIKKEDHSGLPHQLYEIKIDNDITFSIVSNLLFGRIPLALGKTISVCGEYKKVGQGMVHWTHFDPHGPHADGFTILDGVLYGDKEEALVNRY